MEIAHQGGLFITRRLPDDSSEGKAVIALNRTLQEGLGLQRGVSHSEFIGRSDESDGSGGPASPKLGGVDPSEGGFVFLETSARVGGAFIVDTIDAASGINLWQEWAKIEKSGLEAAHFAWAGGLEPGQPHYYRVQGGTFVLEYDNTQNDANHVHSVWRDFAHDFGADLLGKHVAEAHR